MKMKDMKKTSRYEILYLLIIIMPVSLSKYRKQRHHNNKLNPKQKKVQSALMKKPGSKTPTIYQLLSNIHSKNVSTPRTRYFSQGRKILINQLEKNNKDRKFDIQVWDSYVADLPSVLPIIQHFRMGYCGFPEFRYQLIVYETLKKKSSYMDVYNLNIKDIHNVFAFINSTLQKQTRLNHYESIPLSKYNDRISLEYGIEDDSYFVRLVHVNYPLSLKSSSSSQTNRYKAVKEFRRINTIFQHNISPVSWGFSPTELEYDCKPRIIKELKRKTLKKIPLSLLLLSHTQHSLHIEYGYTYQDSRKFGISTKLRKLVQLFALEKGYDFITTEAVAWGSQIASNKAGFFGVKSMRKNIINNKTLKGFQSGFKQNFYSGCTKEPTSFRKWREAVHKQTGYLTPKQKKMLTTKYKGKIPVSAYQKSTGSRSVGYLEHPMHNNVEGTHLRRLTKNVGNNLLNPRKPRSLYNTKPKAR